MTTRIAGVVVDVTLARILEILMPFVISLSGETQRPLVLDCVSLTFLSVFRDHSARYLSGLRASVAQEELLGQVDTHVSRLVALRRSLTLCVPDDSVFWSVYADRLCF